MSVRAGVEGLFGRVLIVILGALPTVSNAGTVGVDLRRALKPNDFEFSAVGMVMNIGHTCSATRVSHRIAITNRHCLIEPNQEIPLAEVRDALILNGVPRHASIARGATLGPAIATGVVNGQAANVFPVREVWWGRAGDPGEDWAVIQLDEGTRAPGGEAFTLAKDSELSPLELVGHAAYSEAYFLNSQHGHIQNESHALRRVGHVLEHDAANSRGASGGPVWKAGTHQIIAINSFELCDKKFQGSEAECAAHASANGAVTVEAFASVVNQLIAQGY